MTNDNKTQSKPEKRKCKKCGSTLRAIGKDRANGKPGRKGAFSDWWWALNRMYATSS